MMGSQPRIWLTMGLLSLPLMTVGLSIFTGAAGE